MYKVSMESMKKCSKKCISSKLNHYIVLIANGEVLIYILTTKYKDVFVDGYIVKETQQPI